MASTQEKTKSEVSGRRPFSDLDPSQLQGILDSAFYQDMLNRLLEKRFGSISLNEGDDAELEKKIKLIENNEIKSSLMLDAALRAYDDGDIIIRQGDYGHSIFIILDGDVRVVKAPPLTDAEFGYKLHTKPRGWWKTFKILFGQSKQPEYRNPKAYALPVVDPHSQRARLKPQVLEKLKNDQKRTELMHSGGLFGEIAALTRSERNATIFSDGASVLIEIRWQGLRKLMQIDKVLKDQIEQNYRRFGLQEHLRNNPPFNQKKKTDEWAPDSLVPTAWNALSQSQQEALINRAIFKTYGKLEWYRDEATETPIVEQGQYVEYLLMVRSGFARVSVKLAQGLRTTAILRRGDTFGLEEIAYNRHNSGHSKPYQRSLHAIGYADIIALPVYLVEELLFEQQNLMVETQAGLSSSVVSVENDMMDFLIDHRFINGTKTMLINLDRCVRCDDCVRGCASTHDNNPRFLRHGKVFKNIMVANACMHCTDAVCMIGCPTGAIQRDREQGWVVINDQTCIGCATCANSCPYDNIRMVQVRDNKGQFMRGKRDADGNLRLDNEQDTIYKATKCDLCIDNVQVSPACERACPHDALKRVDMRDTEALARWLKR